MPVLTRLDEHTGTEITINYEVVGDGKETIVFHHGNGNCIDDWHTLGFVDALKNEFRLILIDSRGYGKSSKPHDPKEYSLKSRANDTIAVLDQEKIDKAHCLGASVGAATCFLLARFYPQRFKSYIFATPYFTLFESEMKEELKDGIEAYVTKLEALIGGPIENSAIRETFLANDALALFAANSSEWFDYRDYLKYLSAPTLIYLGAKEPSLRELRTLSERINTHSEYPCQLHIFPNATHAEVYWAGKMVAPVISDFIQDTVNCEHKPRARL